MTRPVRGLGSFACPGRPTRARLVVLGVLMLTMGPAGADNDDRLLAGSNVHHGREVFLRYCAGCHGFNGFAFYPYAPSFAMGDRMHKGDAELMRSILNGRGAMPSWDNKLPRPWLRDALAYLRHMNRMAVIGRLPSNDPPEEFFVFPAYGGQTYPDWPIPSDGDP